MSAVSIVVVVGICLSWCMLTPSECAQAVVVVVVAVGVVVVAAADAVGAVAGILFDLKSLANEGSGALGCVLDFARFYVTICHSTQVR